MRRSLAISVSLSLPEASVCPRLASPSNQLCVLFSAEKETQVAQQLRREFIARFSWQGFDGIVEVVT
jgi:hypothetical protein